MQKTNTVLPPLIPLEQRVDAMASLDENWDGYGADRIKPEAMRVAKAFLRTFCDNFRLQEPQVAPMRTGGVAAFWWLEPHELELEINATGSEATVSYVYENHENGEILSGSFKLQVGSRYWPVVFSAIAVAFNRPPIDAITLSV